MNALRANPRADPNFAEIASTECDCLLQNPALLHAVLKFNGFCVPPDLGAKSDPLPGRLRVLLAAHPRLWRFFPMPAQRRVVWCFEPAPNRLALLPPPLLERLGVYWSAAVWAEEWARIIEKTCLAQLMEQIGPEVYRYAVRRGRFQLGGLRLSLWEAPKEAPARQRQWNAETFRRPGEKILALCLAQWPESLRAAWEEHWRWPLPKEDPLQQSISFSALWFWVEKILCTEVAPEWQPCFSS